MPTDLWNVQQYEKFKLERMQPGLDLIALVQPKPGMRVVDLGCGTGELTALLHEKLPGASTVGMDRSPAMLAKAAAVRATGLMFVSEDIGSFAREDEFDLVFSNAAIHWVPDHEALLTRLTRTLRSGGQLAIQLPCNFDHPAYVAAREIAAQDPYRQFTASMQPLTALPAEEYALILDRLGMQDVHVRMQVYIHHLESRDDVVEWLRGTFLTDYQKAIPNNLFDKFVEEFRSLVHERLPDLRPFPFTFKRILMHAVKP